MIRVNGALVALALLVGAAGFLLQSDRAAASGNSIAIPEPVDVDGGTYISLDIDASGRPVLSHFDRGTLDLKVLRCGDANCTSGNITSYPDLTGDDVGRYSALVLDGADNPVVAYQDVTAGSLKIVHCGNPTCTSGNTFATPDTIGSPGFYNSIVLDGAGNPVVSYTDVSANLEVLHCGDPACSAGNTIATPDPGVAGGTSLALDGAGNPVVAYYDYVHSYLKVLHCGDPACTAGNSFATPDTTGSTGYDPSLALDAAGNPVISYADLSLGHLKLLHCGDLNCTGANSITVPDPLDGGTDFTSIVLDAVGNPVIAFHDIGLQTLKVLHCAEPTCVVPPTVIAPDPTGNPSNDVGLFASLALDAMGNPVVAYKYNNAGQLRVVHCGNPLCTKGKAPFFGDANCDGTVNAIDAAFMLQFGAGLITALPCPAAADVNRDGSINSIDVALVLQYIAGLIGHLPP